MTCKFDPKFTPIALYYANMQTFIYIVSFQGEVQLGCLVPGYPWEVPLRLRRTSLFFVLLLKSYMIHGNKARYKVTKLIWDTYHKKHVLSFLEIVFIFLQQDITARQFCKSIFYFCLFVVLYAFLGKILRWESVPLAILMHSLPYSVLVWNFAAFFHRGFLH